jgi:hypothetical protein
MTVLTLNHCIASFIWLGRVRPPSPYVGSVQSPRGLHFGSHPYHQPPTYNYQQGVVYPYG